MTLKEEHGRLALVPLMSIAYKTASAMKNKDIPAYKIDRNFDVREAQIQHSKLLRACESHKKIDVVGRLEWLEGLSEMIDCARKSYRSKKD